jgi:hypothetical protein
MIFRGLLLVASLITIVGLLWTASQVLFLLTAQRCQAPTSNDEAHTTEIHFLLVSDVHLLGSRKRLWIEQLWIDWQASLAYQSALYTARPDVVIFLGDQLDEGTAPTGPSAYEVEHANAHRSFLSQRRTLFLS